MGARDDDPRIHRIEVERTANGGVESVRFVCDGGDDAPCHKYPDCGCEQWRPEEHGLRVGQRYYDEDAGEHRVATEAVPPAPGHQDVQQPECWILPWFNETTGSPVDFADLYYGEDSLTVDDLRDGPVSVTFEGDYMTWGYAS